MNNRKIRGNLYIYAIPSILFLLFIMALIALSASNGEVYEERILQLRNEVGVHVASFENGISTLNEEFMVFPVAKEYDEIVLKSMLKNSYFRIKSIPCLFDGQGFVVPDERGNITELALSSQEKTLLLDLIKKQGDNNFEIAIGGETYTVFAKTVGILPGYSFLLLVDSSELKDGQINPIWLLFLTSMIILTIISVFYGFFYLRKNNKEKKADDFNLNMGAGIKGDAMSMILENYKAEESDKVFESIRKLIEISSKMSFASRKRDDVFLKDLLEMLLSLIPKADYGTISVIREGKWVFLHSVGHDGEALKTLDIDCHGIKKIGKTTVVKNIYEHECEIMPEEYAEIIRKATKPTSTSIITPLMIGKDQIGSINIDIAEFKKLEFDDFDMRLVDSFSGMATSFLAIQEYMKTHGKFQKQIIMSLVKILEIHDPYTKGHSENVASMAAQIAENLGWAREKISRVYWAGLIHDIGKIFVPPSILCKPGKLTESEFETIKKHPEWGAEILRTSEGLEDIVEFVNHHHERWDGRGYPDGLKADEIPVISRIISVVDAFDAMTSDRPYRPSVNKEIAISEIVKNSGTQFDPAIVKAFEEIFIEAEDLAGRK